jgi:hypothetical protein
MALERTDLCDSTTLHPGGLEPVGTILRSTHPDLVVSKQKLRRAGVIELVREKRETANHTLGFASRPFVLCGFRRHEELSRLAPSELFSGHLTTL